MWTHPLRHCGANHGIGFLISQIRTRHRNGMPRFVQAGLASTAVEGQPECNLRSNNGLCRHNLNVDANIDIHSYGFLLQAATHNKSPPQGKLLHRHIIIAGHTENIFLGTQLATMYAICGRMIDARLVFDRIPEKNAALYNMMIKVHACNGGCEEALALYYQMQREGIQPDNFTFPFVLKACAALSALQDGKEIHYHIARAGYESNVYVGNALVVMYAKCGRMDIARQVFDRMPKRNVVSWNAVIAGLVQNGRASEALTVLRQMQLHGVKPNLVTIVSVLRACAHIAALEHGKDMFNYIIKNKFELDGSVGNSLVAMYSKCGCLEIARKLFDKLSKRDVVSWNAMIAGYTQNGHAKEALTLFHQMQMEDVKPDQVTIVCVLPACADLADLQQGKGVHDHVIKNGFEVHVSVQNSLIDMYAKCGRIDIARQLFDRMSERSVVSWSAMIAGYGMHGQGEDALALFFQMLQTGVKPDYITFICVLSACSHAGLVDEGWHYFDGMVQDYCITPRQQHYACMVDLLGRAGHLDEAQDFIEKMPLEPGATVWGALLGACRIHCNADLGERVAERLFDVDPENAGHYIQLSNIYAAAGRWDDVAKVRTMMKDRGLKKTAGCSLIEINNRIHAFLMGDRSHPQSEKIYAMLETLAEQMKKAGYVPDMNFVLHDVEEDVKEHKFCSHSEKLDIAFGLMNTNFSDPYSDHKSSTYVW